MASEIGSVVGLSRYPVKSMMGEELNASELTDRGILGDRACALVDAETGKVVSAKEPRKWSRMFEFRAAYVEPPRWGRPSACAGQGDLPKDSGILRAAAQGNSVNVGVYAAVGPRWDRAAR